MNVFYVEPKHVFGNQFELTGQEARHAIKVMRVRVGDEIHATNGNGKRFSGTVQAAGKDSVKAVINQIEEIPLPDTEVVLAMGIIKKRDRLEFAVEKAVELGASKMVLFNSDHAIKTNVRMDRLQHIAQSAMKQSLRVWLPEVVVLNSLDEVLEEFSGHTKLMAHEKTNTGHRIPNIKHERILLMAGPEGGFSDREVELATDSGAVLASLGEYRLRAETAAIAFLNRLIE